MAVHILIHGAGGRMGQEIARAALGDSRFIIAACVERYGHPLVGKDIGLACGGDTVGVTIEGDLPACVPAGTVVVDFSTPEAVVELFRSLPGGIGGAVIGTTGLTEEHKAHIREAAEKIPIVISANMSMGVNLMFGLVQLAARVLRGYDIEIVEIHHRHKKDAPSGTARQLAEMVVSARGLDYEKAVVHGRSGLRDGDRPVDEVGMHAARGGDVVGEHTVMFLGDGERLEIRHMATSRKIFAHGALVAAQWVSERGPGLYSMAEVLGIMN